MSSENSNPKRRVCLWLATIFWTLTVLSAWSVWAGGDPKFLVFTATMALSGLLAVKNARRYRK
jgi:hypothetical protein